ncbi:SRPBCC family protein [Pseudovibrio sp. Tun.PSC04-5.I4]|uniref:SRPBCC family protein n=1 Tax=Pseudovibrio sp. Tun.PSC04-5.I4 TaxID=1798213 RepID=UPI00088FBC7B|nr:SRPBCC family protein [Pseudovibrio sp. Tun.PSC04-5.I4]SDR35150.1 Carbon monoxide dehydrogenase subunit G [Pseudovibrio sp. Tun.PSC04-5.I4]
MIHFERSLLIDAAPDAVWAVLSRYMHIDEFAPQITSVDALTTGDIGLGSKRRNNFANGTSLVEEITAWKPVKGYTVKLSDMAAMPLNEASSEIRTTPTGGRTRVTWTFDYRVKYGLLGWLMGQTLMKMMMGKIIDGNLKGLSQKVLAG